MMYRTLAWVALATVLGSEDAVSAEAGTLIKNPSFEEQADGQPAGWKTHTWRGEARFQYETKAHSGKHSVAVSSEKGADAGWFAIVPVEPYSSYRLTGWIKTENVEVQGGRGALLNLHNIQPAATNALTGTRDWTRVELVFDTDEQDSIQVNCLFGGWGLATGKAWYDDLRLERLSSRNPNPSITIDAGRPGAPISKYIYGQFIEHLGRCIYGGIWAEMLEDRKFFDPVGSEASPWKAVGEPGSVEMIREGTSSEPGGTAFLSNRVFVGEQTPRIALAGQQSRGIAQGGLGLRQGKSYVGRIWLAADPGVGPVSVSLVWGDGPEQRQTITIETLTADYAKTPLRFTAGGNTDDGRLEIVARGTGSLRVGTVSLMPADNVHGMRADTLELLKQLDAPVYRWPGGNFVSGYRWIDGIGDPDRRPPRKNPAWKGIEHNDFGLDEFMTFCRVLGTEPLVVVNSGLGDVAMAVEEIEYANGSPDSPQGKLRAQNGHPEPYGVKWWGIGNEMYGRWQLGHMPLEQYVEKHNRFAEAMRAVDPSVKLIAVGSVGPWSETMLARCADQMDLISEHFYVGEKPGVIAHVRQAAGRVRAIAEAHRRYRKEIPALEGKEIPVALDEWNYWYGPHLYGELGTRYFLKDALGVAAALNEYARQSDMYFMANYAQTVNVIGCIKTTKTDAAFDTTGLPLMLYRKQFGTVPIETTTGGPLDAAAAWSPDRKSITLAVVNPMSEKLEVPFEVRGAGLTGTGRVWEISGSDPMAYNEPGKPPAVAIRQREVSGVADVLPVPPLSVSLFCLDVKP